MHSVSALTKRPESEEKPMRRILAIILFAATFFGGIAMAKDPVVGTWT